VTTFITGRKAEAAAASFLELKGCIIVAQNWRTRWCEIDIVAFRQNIVYFCEVKYRGHNRQGDGLDYITPAKLRRMHFAANMWLAAHRWVGDVTGPDFRVQQAIKIAI
jgi:uncharacterized protein (TIGR00252 family)